ncbi:MAG TPA: hypothetical protein VEW92_06885 [Nitrososphaeraceae archaeon]|nr:hypothetical protein [Nitrososphaeraceae archaeon]
MLQLEESNRGYNLDDGLKPVPGGAYADDMVLHANRNKELQYLFNDAIDYFTFVDLTLAFDGRDKSVYTNNTDSLSRIYIEKFTEEKWKREYLSYFESDELYKYLGVWINLQLNWKDQTNALKFAYNKYIYHTYTKNVLIQLKQLKYLISWYSQASHIE